MEDTANTFQGSPQQDDQWRREPEGPTGRVQALVRLEGALDEQALAGALRQVVDRHEILRTTFVHQPGIRIPLQAVADTLEPRWETAELAEQELAGAMRRELEAPLDFAHGPLLRALHVRHAPQHSTLILTASSLCADPSSLGLLVAELGHGLGAGGELAAEPLQYADFAAWQAELSDSDDEEARSARENWAALAGAAQPSIPFTRPSTGPFLPAETEVELPGDVSPELLQACWHGLLARISGEPSLAVGYLSPDRRHEDLEGAIGAFARPVPLLVSVEDDPSSAELTRRIAAQRAQATVLQDYAPAQAHGGPQIGFLDYEAYSGRAGDLTIALGRIIATGHPWRLWLSCARGGSARLQFDPAGHDADAVARLAGELQALVQGAIADPEKPVSELDVLGEAEREQVLRAFNDTASAAPRSLVHERFAAHAAGAPDRAAAVDEHGTITYGELETRANQLANRLRAAGIGPDVTVGLCIDRSIEMVVGLLGILKAGGAYVPLNYEHPAARLRTQLEQAEAKAIVTQESLLGRLPEFAGQVVCTDRDRAELDREPASAPATSLNGENLAYVIYTSGSTGTPKGVAVTHGSLANYAADITRRLGADGAPLAFGLVTSIATDLGNTSVFGALASGGTLVLPSPQAAGDAAALARFFEANPLDVLKITPSHIGALLSGGDPHVLPRRTLVIGGERAPWDLIERVRALSGCSVLNHYGPTEATIGCCTFPVSDGPGPYAPASVPIGRPISNTRCYVLDGNGKPVPIGCPGGLFIAGDGVARGYIGQLEATAAAFVPDPFSGGRMYDTGDVVRWLPDGALEFLGRRDEQVKIRGYRVEPGEVESALRAHPAIEEAIVTTPETSTGERRLVAYFTARESVDPAELRAHLSTLLPEFMLPSAMVAIDAVPRTPSGKIDRLALPEPEAVQADQAGAKVAPRTPTEQAIAAIWESTLGIRPIGVDDDFFEIGGHSLLATQVVAQIRVELAVDLPLHALFTSPTVGMLAEEVLAMMGASEQDETERLLAELAELSDEEAERLLASESQQTDA